MHPIQAVFAVLAAVISFALPTWATPPPAAFGYNRTSFLLHGKPFVIIGGQMDPQRIPFEYWQRRIVAAKAMGINTIFSNIFWNELEPEKDKWDNTKVTNNITDFVDLAHQEGLYVVLRPGPYVGGERDWGGLPYWLSRIPGLKVRSFNAPFLNATSKYLARLAKDLARFQITKGGNIIMVQIENEYGSYGADMRYKEALRNMAASLFDVPLYTADSRNKLMLDDGHVSRVLSVVNGGPQGFATRDEAITDESSLGPQLDGEAYITKPLHHGSNAQYHTSTQNNPDLVETYLDNLRQTLSANHSLNLHMLHGGTNFGLSTGSLHVGNTTIPWTNSHHDGSPIDEAGRTTPLYHALRDEILKFLPDPTAVPDPPEDLPLMKINDFQLTPYATVFNTVAQTETHRTPIYMEMLKQAQGLVLYEHKLQAPANGTLQAGDRPRDRVVVYVNGRRKGTIDSLSPQKAAAAPVSLSLKKGDTLQLLVENVGRPSYWHKGWGEPNPMDDPFKGINGSVTVGTSVLQRWKIFKIPCREPPLLKKQIKGGIQKGIMPVYYRGKFKVPLLRQDQYYSEMDTYLTIQGGTRGIVWVNGYNLGRFDVAGPQQSLYLPGILLRHGFTNRITVLEMNPWNTSLVARGDTVRTWENHPDPRAPA